MTQNEIIDIFLSNTIFPTHFFTIYFDVINNNADGNRKKIALAIKVYTEIKHCNKTVSLAVLGFVIYVKISNKINRYYLYRKNINTNDLGVFKILKLRDWNKTVLGGLNKEIQKHLSTREFIPVFKYYYYYYYNNY